MYQIPNYLVYQSGRQIVLGFQNVEWIWIQIRIVHASFPAISRVDMKRILRFMPFFDPKAYVV